MTNRKNILAAINSNAMGAWARSRLAPMLRNRILATTLLASLLAVLYWGLICSDRYVSEARVMIQRTDFSSVPGINIGAILGTGTKSNQEDQLLLRDHLLSMDMLRKLDAKLDLRAHYSDSSHDLISRMWLKDASIEWFYRYFLTRVEIEYDEYSGVLSIKAQAYDPKKAYAITAMLVEEGERFMNALGHALAQEQVTFLEKQVVQMQDRVLATRKVVLEFQNRKGLISPQATAENLVAIVSRIEAQLAELKARRAAMLSYLMPTSAGVVELDFQIAALEKQAEAERQRLTSPKGGTLNRVIEEYQRLELNAKFAEDVYKTALAALESGRVEATRTLKKVSIVQKPFEPQRSMEPRRLYSITVFVLLAFVTAGMLQLFAAIIRDHKD
jgi:capsular polysaccharide transport system permease protein